MKPARFSKRRSSRPHSAHVSSSVVIRYRWPPLHGPTGRLQKQVNRRDCGYLFCLLPNGTIGAVPQWMTDAVVCSRHSLGRPIASLEALSSLNDLLEAVAPCRNTRSRRRSPERKDAIDGSEVHNKHVSRAPDFTGIRAAKSAGDSKRNRARAERSTGGSAARRRDTRSRGRGRKKR